MRNLLVLLFLICFNALTWAQSRNTQIKDSLFVALEINKDEIKKFDIYEELGNCYVYSSQPDSVLWAAKQMIQIAHKLKRDSLMGTAIAYRGVAYSSYRNKYDSAFIDYFAAVDYLSKARAYNRRSFVFKQIAFLFRELKDFAAAIEYLNKAKEYLPMHGILPNRIYTNLSDTYIKINQIDSALYYAQLAELNTDVANDAYGYSRTLYLLGMCFDKKGQKELGKTYLQRALEYSTQQNIKPTIMITLEQLAQMALEDKDYIKAEKLATTSLEVAKTRMFPMSWMHDYKILLQCAEHRGDKISFINSFQKIQEIEAELNNQTLLNNIQSFQLQQLLNEKNEKQLQENAALFKKHSLQYSFLVLGLILLILFLIVFSNSFLANLKVIQFFSTLVVISLFEILSLLFHSFIEEITHHNPWILLCCISIFALLCLPIKNKFEAFLKRLFETRAKTAKQKYVDKYLVRE